MLTIFAGLYQFERECTLERQREGIALAKKAGKYKGRKPLEVDNVAFKALYTDWKAVLIEFRNRTENLCPKNVPNSI